MIFLIPKKTSKIFDEYVLTAIVNILGMIVFTDILFLRFGLVSVLYMLPIYLYFLVTSISLALARWWLIDRMNKLSEFIYFISERTLKTEIMLKTKERKIYKRRILLLQKHYEVYFMVFDNMRIALEKLKDMKPKTLQKVTQSLVVGDNIAKTKIFLDKNINYDIIKDNEK